MVNTASGLSGLAAGFMTEKNCHGPAADLPGAAKSQAGNEQALDLSRIWLLVAARHMQWSCCNLVQGQQPPCLRCFHSAWPMSFKSGGIAPRKTQWRQAISHHQCYPYKNSFRLSYQNLEAHPAALSKKYSAPRHALGLKKSLPNSEIYQRFRTFCIGSQPFAKEHDLKTK